ncbi:hypothetical protein [Enterobacter asburiae]|uniref:hypothetical protein n=1 Tax=Enterobacter asburiae TaxID=61645 RepID=UPI003F67AC4E
MEIAYLCLARLGDVLSVQKAHLLPKEIFIRQEKLPRNKLKHGLTVWHPPLNWQIHSP